MDVLLRTSITLIFLSTVVRILAFNPGDTGSNPARAPLFISILLNLLLNLYVCNGGFQLICLLLQFSVITRAFYHKTLNFGNRFCLI